MSLADVFADDIQGRRFADVANDARLSFGDILGFFDDPGRQQRMIDSELHHDRPPVAGVIRELESRDDVHGFFLANEASTTTRFRQAVGVIVRIIMDRHGWHKTGRKGSLGVRVDAAKKATGVGVYRNTGGLSLWFTRAERYVPTSGAPFRSVSERAKEVEATFAGSN